jgi:hypothetical protein
MVPVAIPIAFLSISLGFVCYSILRNKFPGRGLKVIQNAFKQTISFEEALKAMKEGNRIRRKTESKGFIKFIITEGRNTTEKYGTYWAGNKDSDFSSRCCFSIEDVLATDWIIDE